MAFPTWPLTLFGKKTFVRNWSAGGALGTARRALVGAGVQTDALACGGYTTLAVVTVEEYDGTTWATGGNLDTARYVAGGGGAGQTDGLVHAGFDGTTNLASTEEYNGTSWAAGGNIGTARRGHGSGGIQTDAIAAGGKTPTVVASTEEYNGTSWAAGGDLGTAKDQLFGAGSGQATLFLCGGRDAAEATQSATEVYDGTSWSAGGALGLARWGHGAAGTKTAGLVFGSDTGPSASTEEYASSVWTEAADLLAARGTGPAGAGTQTLGLCAGGYDGGSNLSSTEEYA